jgi:prepilin-type processing-associated H-X9-DG protein
VTQFNALVCPAAYPYKYVVPNWTYGIKLISWQKYYYQEDTGNASAFVSATSDDGVVSYFTDLGRYKNPARALIMTDTVYETDTPGDGAKKGWQKYYCAGADFQIRHNRQANFLWGDNHVQPMTAVDIRNALSGTNRAYVIYDENMNEL